MPAGSVRYLLVLAPALLYLTLAFCALAIGLAVVRYDLYDREPWPMLLLAVALGAAGMYLSYHAEVAVIRLIHRSGEQVSYTALAFLAGIVEELAKAAGVVTMALAVRRHFNDPLDGLVYGSFIGLGAAIEESVALLAMQQSLAALPATEPVRLVGHLIMGGIGGFGLGVLTLQRGGAWWAVGASLLGAIGLHIAWDLAAFAQLDAGPRLTVPQIIIPVMLMLLGMLVYRRLAALGARMTLDLLHLRGLRPPLRSPA